MMIVSSNSSIFRNHSAIWREIKLCTLRIYDHYVVVSAMSWKIICISICLFSVISIGFCAGIQSGMPQNGRGTANVYSGNNQINQNLNQNAFGLSGFGSGAGGLVWLPQNGINIANANGGNNQINQNLNQNAFGG